MWRRAQLFAEEVLLGVLFLAVIVPLALVCAVIQRVTGKRIDILRDVPHPD